MAIASIADQGLINYSNTVARYYYYNRSRRRRRRRCRRCCCRLLDKNKQSFYCEFLSGY